MVAGKVKVAMGLQKSPAPSQTPPPQKKKKPPPSPSPTTSSTKSSSHKSSFTRSFGAYFPRSSAQVQPRPPDVTELLRLVEELRESESRLKTELLGHKLLKESIAIVPVLEHEITERETEIQMSKRRTEEAEAENEKLKNELQELKLQMEEEKRENEKKVKALEDEITELKKTASDCSSSRAESLQSDEHDHFSSSQRFQGLTEVSLRSNLIKNLKKTTSDHAIVYQKHNEGVDLKREVVETERLRHSRSNSEELADCADSVLTVNVRSRAPRVPNPPPRASPSSPSSSSITDNSNGETQNAISRPLPPVKAAPPPPPPPPRKPASKAAPPPPPPPPKGGKVAQSKVRRVPEVVEFYHSLMRRDSHSRRDSSSGATTEVPSTANARDMIGEIENRSTHLLAVSAREFCCIITFLPLVFDVSVNYSV